MSTKPVMAATPLVLQFFVSNIDFPTGTLTVTSQDLNPTNPSIDVTYINNVTPIHPHPTEQLHHFALTAIGDGTYSFNRALNNAFRVFFGTLDHQYGSISGSFNPNPTNSVYLNATLTPPGDDDPVNYQAEDIPPKGHPKY